MAETLGSLLRQKRESLGLSLEKVEGFTHIRIKHLQAIESDDLSSIPSVPQARGFIRNYASFLGVNPDEMAPLTGITKPRPSQPPPAAAPSVRKDSTSQKDQPASPQATTRPRAPITTPVVSRAPAGVSTRPLPAASRVRNWLRLDILLGAAVTLAVVALLVWGGYNIALTIQGTATPAATASNIAPGSQTAGTGSPAADLSPAAGSTGTVPAGTGTPSGSDGQTPPASESPPAVTPGIVSLDTPVPTAFPTPLGGVYTDVRIHIIILQQAYLRVDVDGKTAFAGRVQPDETYDYVGRRTVTISTGNGAGIRVIFNGVDEGLMGRFGEVVSHTYTPTGVLTPAPTATLTPTITPTPADTPVP